MPSLRVIKNSTQRCTVGSNDVWMFSASVWGDLWSSELSMLDVTGSGKRGSDGHGDFLTWEFPHELRRGDRVQFFFQDGDVSEPAGTRFDESSEPLDEPKFKMSIPPSPEDIERLESRPVLNSCLTWSVSVNRLHTFELAPDALRQHIGLHILWNEERPDRMRVSLSKSSLREILERTNGEQLFLEYVPVGSCIDLIVSATSPSPSEPVRQIGL